MKEELDHVAVVSFLNGSYVFFYIYSRLKIEYIIIKLSFCMPFLVYMKKNILSITIVKWEKCLIICCLCELVSR